MTLAIKFLVLAVLAIYARAGAVALRRPISDFYVAGRLVPGLFNGMAIAVSLIPVLAFAELAGALSQGWDGATLLVLGGAGGLLIIAFFLAPYLRKFGGYTIADFLGERFGGTGVRPLAVLAVILCSFPALALALLGLGVIATQIFAARHGHRAWPRRGDAPVMQLRRRHALGERHADRPICRAARGFGRRTGAAGVAAGSGVLRG